MSTATPRPAGSHTPAPLRPCDLFSEDIHLLVDGELGVAETALVEEHLQACPRCLSIAARLEAMSSLLKDWDARTNDLPVPALRIKHAVLTRVKEHSVRRRRESRLVGLMHYATAALVLLAIGTGVALGLSSGRNEPAPGDIRSASVSTAESTAESAWPLSAALAETPDFPVHRTEAALATWESGYEPAPLASFELPALAQEPEWDRLGRWEQVWRDAPGRGRIAFLAEHIERETAFASRVGAPSTSWSGPRIDEPGQRLVTIRALNFLHDRGYLEEWKRWTPAPHQAPSTTVVSAPTIRQATGMTAADMLAPMPGVDQELNSLFRRGRLSAFGVQPAKLPSQNAAASASLLEAWPLQLDRKADTGALRSGPMGSGAPGAGAPRAFLDPLKAEANRQLRLREEDDGEGSIVFLVEGTSEPILIPAGQFIDGGFGARVVAETVWLPASKGETPRIVRCRMVENAALGEPKGHPTLVPHIAGPTIRALLAAGASQVEVRAAARRIYALRQHAEYDLFNGWNLLDVYGGATGQRYGEIFAGKLDWRTGRGGFVVRDAGGNLVGAEVLRFQGPAAEALLARLWVGYVVEAVLRHGRLYPDNPELARSKAEVDAALAPSSDELTAALHRIASHSAVFRMPRGFDASQGWRISGLEIVAAGLQLHALEVANQPAYVSILSR
jgi:anti-sigma factor RsiW